MLTQSDLDKILAVASAVRILYPPAARPGYSSQCITVDLTAELSARLRESLDLQTRELPISCHCPGTVSLELLGTRSPQGSLRLHLHRQMHSIWLKGEETGVRLKDGKVILHLLAEWGVPGPLEAVQAAYREQTARAPSFLKEMRELRRQPETPAPVPAASGVTPKE